MMLLVVTYSLLEQKERRYQNFITPILERATQVQQNEGTGSAGM